MLIRSAKLSLSMHSPRCFTTSQSGKVSLQEIWWRLSAQGSTLTTRLPSISSVLFLSSPRLPWRFVALHCVGNNFTRFANLKSNLSMMVFMLYAPHFLTDGTHTGTILNGIVSKKCKKKKRKPEHNGDTGDDGQEHEPEPENNINLAIFLLWRFRMKIQPPSRLWCSFQAHRARQTSEGFQSHHIIQSDILSSCNFACLNLWQDDKKKTRFCWMLLDLGKILMSGSVRNSSSWLLQLAAAMPKLEKAPPRKASVILIWGRR